MTNSGQSPVASGQSNGATQSPTVSVVIPCRNEEAFIGPCVTSVLSGGFPVDRLEILVVDGMSADRTRSIVCFGRDAKS